MRTNPLLAIAALASGLAISSANAAQFLVDFGIAAGNPAQGAPTVSPDANGNYWNNVTSTNVGTTITGGTGNTLSNIVSTTNVSSTISLALSGVWKSSGIGNGGLNQNTPALGNFGIQTATQDYYYVESATATLTISGLAPGAVYDLSMFGSRNVAANRFTLYTVTDAIGSGHTYTLQTSGSALGGVGYDGNNSTIASIPNVVATPGGTLTLTVANNGAGNNFGYLGVLGIQEVPEAGSSLLVCLSGVALAARRRRVR